MANASGRGGARPGAGRPKKGEESRVGTSQPRIDSRIAKAAQFIAVARGTTVTEYLNGILMETVRRDFQAIASQSDLFAETPKGDVPG